MAHYLTDAERAECAREDAAEAERESEARRHEQDAQDADAIEYLAGVAYYASEAE